MSEARYSERLEGVIVAKNAVDDVVSVGLPIYQSGNDYVVLKFMPSPFYNQGTASLTANKRNLLQHLHQQIVHQLAILALEENP